MPLSQPSDLTGPRFYSVYVCPKCGSTEDGVHYGPPALCMYDEAVQVVYVHPDRFTLATDALHKIMALDAADYTKDEVVAAFEKAQDICQDYWMAARQIEENL